MEASTRIELVYTDLQLDYIFFHLLIILLVEVKITVYENVHKIFSIKALLIVIKFGAKIKFFYVNLTSSTIHSN